MSETHVTINSVGNHFDTIAEDIMLYYPISSRTCIWPMHSNIPLMDYKNALRIILKIFSHLRRIEQENIRYVSRLQFEHSAPIELQISETKVVYTHLGDISANNMSIVSNYIFACLLANVVQHIGKGTPYVIQSFFSGFVETGFYLPMEKLRKVSRDIDKIPYPPDYITDWFYWVDMITARGLILDHYFNTTIKDNISIFVAFIPERGVFNVWSDVPSDKNLWSTLTYQVSLISKGRRDIWTKENMPLPDYIRNQLQDIAQASSAHKEYLEKSKKYQAQ